MYFVDTVVVDAVYRDISMRQFKMSVAASVSPIRPLLGQHLQWFSRSQKHSKGSREYFDVDNAHHHYFCASATKSRHDFAFGVNVLMDLVSCKFVNSKISFLLILARDRNITSCKIYHRIRRELDHGHSSAPSKAFAYYQIEVLSGPSTYCLNTLVRG